jgi:hypothetical protein
MENILGSIDNGIKFGKHAYGVISPFLINTQVITVIQ